MWILRGYYSSLSAQWVKDLALSLLLLGSLLWRRFSPWPRNFHMPWVQKKEKILCFHVEHFTTFDVFMCFRISDCSLIDGVANVCHVTKCQFYISGSLKKVFAADWSASEKFEKVCVCVCVCVCLRWGRTDVTIWERKILILSLRVDDYTSAVICLFHLLTNEG